MEIPEQGNQFAIENLNPMLRNRFPPGSRLRLGIFFVFEQGKCHEQFTYKTAMMIPRNGKMAIIIPIFKIQIESAAMKRVKRGGRVVASLRHLERETAEIPAKRLRLLPVHH